MIIVQIVAAVISGIIGDPQDAAAIVVIVLLYALIGTVQEYRAERAVAALREMAAPEARVRREDHIRTIPATDVALRRRTLADHGVHRADLRPARAGAGDRDALFTLGLRSNLTLLGGDHADGGAATRRCLPPGAAIGIQNLPLTGTELLLCFACTSVVSIAVEAVKWLVRRGWLHAS